MVESEKEYIYILYILCVIYIYYILYCCSVIQSCPTLCHPMDCSMPGLPVLHHLLEFALMVMLSSHLILWCLFSFCPQSFPASGTFPVSCLFTAGGQNTGTSASASVLPMNIQDWFPLGLTGWISLQARDSQESSPAPQFEGINFLALSLLYCLALITIHDHWEDHSLDHMDLHWQSSVSAFQHTN